MVFKKIEPQVVTFENPEDSFEGELVSVTDDVGINHAKVYGFTTATGESKTLWGSTVLDSKMAYAKIGERVRITYKGLSEAAKGKKAAKLFDVEVDKAE